MAGDTAWAPRCSVGRTAGSAGPRRRNAQLRWAMRGQDPPSRSQDGDDGGLDGDAGDECIGLGEIDVHLAPDAEFARQVDARLDREACVWEQAASVLGLEIVDVGAIAVHFFTDRVPGTVDEPIFIPRLPDHAAAHD